MRGGRERSQFGRDAGRLGCASLLEESVGPAQVNDRGGDITGVQGAAGQAGQGAGLIMGAGDLAGQAQGQPVRLPSLDRITAGAVECPEFVQHLSVAAPVAGMKPRVPPERPVAMRLAGLEPFELA